ncbi:MAG: septum formation initiator family protein [Solobacterium sp.]|nr:septum formation initiator family protein [Solobacterium sp.]MBR2990933.1 septum formation initiator family protein [Solobacterium sp.]
MTKKQTQKKRRRLSPIAKLLSYILIIVSLIMLYNVGQELWTMFQLRQQLAEAQEHYREVLEENEYLTAEREKLKDPDYVQSYARNNYMLSKDGEQIYYLPEK